MESFSVSPLTHTHSCRVFQVACGRKYDPRGWSCPMDHWSFSHLWVPIMLLIHPVVQLSVGSQGCLLNTSTWAVGCGVRHERLLALCGLDQNFKQSKKQGKSRLGWRMTCGLFSDMWRWESLGHWAGCTISNHFSVIFRLDTSNKAVQELKTVSPYCYGVSAETCHTRSRWKSRLLRFP